MAENKKFTRLINSDGTKQAVALDMVSFDEQTKKLTLYSSVDNTIKEETTIPASEVDATLSQSGLAADAKATGDAVKDVVKVGGTASGFTGIIVGTGEEEIELVEQKDFDAEIAKLNAKVGTPLVANAASAMVDTTKIYVYTGNENGYVNGNWYFYNGTNWESGGVYNAVAVQTDKTLTQENKAADAKKTGDEISELKEDTTQLKSEFTAVNGKLHGNVVTYDTFVQGVRYVSNVYKLVNANNRCTTPYLFELWAGDVISVDTVPSGFRVTFVDSNGGESGWKTGSYSKTANAHMFVAINVSTADGTSSLTPSDFTVSVTVKDVSSRIYLLGESVKKTNEDVAYNDYMLDKKVSFLVDSEYVNKSKTIEDGETGYVANDGSLISSSSLYRYKMTCNPGDEITYNAQTNVAYYAIAFFDSSDGFISGIKVASGNETVTLYCPLDTAYCYLVAYTSVTANIIARTTLKGVQYNSDVLNDVDTLQEKVNAVIGEEYENVEAVIGQGEAIYVNDNGAVVSTTALHSYKLTCEEGQRVLYNSQSNPSYYSVSFFTEDNAFIIGYKPSTNNEDMVVTCPKNTAYCYLTAYTSVYDNIVGRTKLQRKIYYTIERDFAIPSYWDNELAISEETIRANELLIGNKGVQFFFVTDTHWAGNAKHSGEIIGKMSKSLEIPLVVFGGDAIYTHSATKSGAVNELRTFYDAYAKGFNLFSTIGNHDLNSNNNNDTSTYLSNSDLYALMMRREETFADTGASATHCYFDNTSQKVRFIQVSCSNCGLISADDLTWVDARVNELTSDWTVILFSHSYFNGAPAGEDVTIPSASLTNIQHFAALKASAAATIACWIVGHVHRDVSDDTHGLLVIATSCDIYSQSASYGGPTMILGTDTEQCIDCYQINTNDKTIYVTRIGAGDDRQFDYDPNSETFGEIAT